ncbi:MAG: glycosyltransferase [bacterium]|nr:glycosyltransferase [bacterium]
MLLSIIIPAYNVELYIKECLDSIFDNLTPDQANLVEIIVVNDGSTDGTAAVLELYGKRDNLVFLTQHNKGISYARNIGIKTAVGKYLMFVDSDDYLLPGALSRIIDFLIENDDVDIVEYGYCEQRGNNDLLCDKMATPSVTSGNGQKIFVEWKNESLFNALVWTKIVLRSLITENNIYFYEGIFHEDEEWSPRIYAYAKKVLYLPLQIYVYRVRDGSVTHTMTSKNYFDMVKVCDLLFNFSLTPGFSREYADSLKDSVASVYLGIFAGIKQRGKYNQDLIKEIKIREHLIEHSKRIKRRFFYRYVIKIIGVKGFYFFKYSIKNIFILHRDNDR